MHPRERPTTRRQFLIRAGLLSVPSQAPTHSSSACGGRRSPLRRHDTGTTRPAPAVAAGRPGRHPARARVTSRDAPSAGEDADRLGHEARDGRPFNIFNYPPTSTPRWCKAFGKKYGVKVKVTPFDNMDHRRHEAGIGDRARPTSPR